MIPLPKKRTYEEIKAHAERLKERERAMEEIKSGTVVEESKVSGGWTRRDYHS